jgi:hypothetical protein
MRYPKPNLTASCSARQVYCSTNRATRVSKSARAFNADSVGRGGLYSTVPEITTFGHDFLDAGRLGQARILSMAAVEAMSCNQVPALRARWFERVGSVLPDPCPLYKVQSTKANLVSPRAAFLVQRYFAPDGPPSSRRRFSSTGSFAVL